VRLQHKVIGLDLFGRPDASTDERSRRVIAEAEALARRNERVEREARARLARAEERLARARERLAAAQRRRPERRLIRRLEAEVTARLLELRRLAREMESTPAYGDRWSGRGAVRFVPKKGRPL
jgi:hypothetical protein